MSPHKPRWFKDDLVMVSSAPTCGINKDGHEQFSVDLATGRRSTETIDDRLMEDVQAALAGAPSLTLRAVPLETIDQSGIAVPVYYDPRPQAAFDHAMATELKAFSELSLGELIDAKVITLRRGHGSPSSDQRIGNVPYIKVSDLRAGSVNINPTNMVPEAVARKHWRGPSSGLEPYDLISPERASKNIGDFCVLMPGQERIVLTRETLVLRVGPEADFDAFFLLWAMTLKIVRAQWARVVFMQTNREDVGPRYREIRIPIAPDRATADRVSEPFRAYYKGMEGLRVGLRAYLESDESHHFFIGVADEKIEDAQQIADEVLPSR